MNIKQYLIEANSPLEMSRFADFSSQLKKQYKTLDGYAFDFNSKDVSAIKFYYKIYTKDNKFDNNFFRWFLQNDMFYYAFKGYYNPLFSEVAHRGLTGINFAIKNNIKSKQIIKSIYFRTSNTSSLVINSDGVNTWTNKYYYIYNSIIIKLINKLFKLNMPQHQEAIELSIRRRTVHASIFPRFNRASLDLEQSKKYCLNLMPGMIIDNSLPAQNIPLTIHCHDMNSSFITKGYTSNNEMQKIYFGCFDWKKSIFKN